MLRGGGAAGDLVRVGQRAALHLSQHTLLVQRGLEEPGVAVELHQVKDLQREIGRERERERESKRGEKERLRGEKERGKKREGKRERVERWKRVMGEGNRESK